MSCFVAIPSNSDIDGGRFLRGDWKSASQVIHLTTDGTIKLVAADKVTYNGLVIVSRPFLSENTNSAKALLLRADGLNPKIDGVFLHPGKTNSPSKAEVRHVLDSLPKELQCIAERTVAFTHSGERSYQVAYLHIVWEWLAGRSLKDAQTKVPGFDFASLQSDFERLRRFGSTDLLVELYVLAQGCVDDQVAETARAGFRCRLQELLAKKESWLKQDRFFCKSVSGLLDCGEKITPKDVQPFLEKIREFLKAPMD